MNPVVQFSTDFLFEFINAKLRIPPNGFQHWNAFLEDIRNKGILNPIELNYDKKGLKIYEGNHRCVAARQLQLATVPVRFTNKSVNWKEYMQIIESERGKCTAGKVIIKENPNLPEGYPVMY